MDKSADAFRTISEVAEHLETPAHVLRFWESRFPQIRPVKRAGGRRYYRPSDVALLTGIKRLLHNEGMTIRGVQKILREQGVRHVAGITGEEADDDSVDVAGDDDQIVDTFAVVQAKPAAFRPAPGLSDAMAKAADHRHSDAAAPAPSATLKTAEPAETNAAEDREAPFEPATSGAAQGRLLLTPSPLNEEKAGDANLSDSYANSTTVKDGIVAMLGAERQDDGGQAGVVADPPKRNLTAFPDTIGDAADFDAADFDDGDFDDGDFDDGDFDDGPVQTLASRIRALPQGASAAKVGAELLDVVARLQALRDALAEAAQTGRG